MRKITTTTFLIVRADAAPAGTEIEARCHVEEL